MKPRLKSTRAARDLIRAHEPFHGEAVRRGKRWVVGYGHTAAAKAGVTLSREDAELLLIYDVLQAETAVHAALGEDLPAPVRDALVSFAASVGLSAFKVSDVARLAKAGRLEAAANALETWVRAEEDGRLVTSERLAARRAAEKALMLEALAPQSPVPQPVAAQPETTAAPQAPAAAPEAAPQPETPAAETGPLIDVDIAFEDPETDAPMSAPDAAEPAEAQPEPEPAAGVDPEAPADVEAEAQPSAAEEPASAPETPDRPEDAVKAAQDAAIQAVMGRMAGEIARSVSVTGVKSPAQAREPEAPVEDAPAPAAGPETDLSDVRLGYSFLIPDVIGIRYDAPAPQPAPEAESDPAPAPAPAQTGVDDEGDLIVEADAPAEDSGEAAGPGRAAASPAPGPVYATVAVGTAPRAETAPPHPAEAPAFAAGLSGESEGPDHPEDADHDEPGEDEAELEPAIVAGPEATYVADETPPGAVEGRGDWVHSANLVAGTALTGLGAWQIGSNLDAYLAQGLGYNWFGPAAFAGGVLLLVSSGWVVIGKMTSKKKS